MSMPFIEEMNKANEIVPSKVMPATLLTIEISFVINFIINIDSHTVMGDDGNDPCQHETEYISIIQISISRQSIFMAANER